MNDKYDKTIEESFKKAVNLSNRDEETVYVIRHLPGFRAVSIKNVLLANNGKKPVVVCTVHWRGGINED